jgi:hypothetical protein
VQNLKDATHQKKREGRAEFSTNTPAHTSIKRLFPMILLALATSETAEKFRFVLAVAMRGRKQVMGNFPAWHNRALGIRQFHFYAFDFLAMRGDWRSVVVPSIRRKPSRRSHVKV